MRMAPTVPVLAAVGKRPETVGTGALLVFGRHHYPLTLTMLRCSTRPSNDAQALHFVCPSSFDEVKQLGKHGL